VSLDIEYTSKYAVAGAVKIIKRKDKTSISKTELLFVSVRLRTRDRR